MRIVMYGNPILKKKSESVDKVDKELLQTMDEMIELMVEANGVGLAANQVGIAKRFFVMKADNNVVRKIINPEIVDFIGEDEEFEEGCLSIPGIYKKVIRPESIRIKYINDKNEEVEEVLTEYEARIFQHEFDHLNGELFVEKISQINKRLIINKLDKLKKEEKKISNENK